MRDSANNKTWTLPLWLNAASTDALHALFQTIHSQLVQGNQVAFTPEGATNTSYFDLEAGKLDPHWDLYEDTVTRLRCSLTLWTRPYGHTGTTRLVASALGSGPVQLAVTGILGDAEAYLNLNYLPAALSDATSGKAIVGTAFAYDYGGLIAAGVKAAPAASFVGILNAASLRPASTTNNAPYTATLVGASGALASQYVAVAVPANSAGRIAEYALPPQSDFPGRYRVFAWMRHAYRATGGANVARPCVYLELGQDPKARRAGGLGGLPNFDISDVTVVGTAPVTATQGGLWELEELGELTIASGIASQAVAIGINNSVTTDLPVATAAATYAAHISGVALVPVDYGAVVYKPGRSVASGEAFQANAYPVVANARTTASGAIVERLFNARGGDLRVPAVGTSATGISKVVTVAAGEQHLCLPMRGDTVSVSVLERFTFLR